MVSGGAVSVTRALWRRGRAVSVKAGDRVEVGDVICPLRPPRSTPPPPAPSPACSSSPGDNVETVTQRYGAALYIAPGDKYSISADIDKAYNDSANTYVNIGETVYISCTSDGEHTAAGVIVAAEGTTYTVETTSGELMMEETVTIYRSADLDSESRLGQGTVSRTAETPVTGTGSIVPVHVSDGEPVERGQLLFETVTGDWMACTPPTTRWFPRSAALWPSSMPPWVPR